MQIKQNHNLKNLNTFGINAQAKFFAVVEKESDIPELFTSPEFRQSERIFLGGGSNILFTKDFDGIVILNKLHGVEILEEDDDRVTIRAMGGENWHDLVMFTTERGYWGIENLALIPGSVGAAPMQNIGAYGVELKNTLVNVEAYEIATGDKKIFQTGKCGLGYRDSVFKQQLKGKYFISAITLCLSKHAEPKTGYKILSDYLTEHKIEIKSSKDISDAVAAIRQSKLPDPKTIPNAGSFFKNIFVDAKKFETLKQEFPDLPSFQEGAMIKIPAAWLIEQCGPAGETSPARGGASWKGYREGNVGVHERQALVLVNHGGASGAELLDLANKIKISVKEQFGLDLIPEVNIV